MAKFLAELLGCTLPSKGASPMFESKSHSRVGLKASVKQKATVFSTLGGEKSLSDSKKEQQWNTSMYSSITPVCFTSPLIDKPVGKNKELRLFLAPCN
ncbi:ras-GEF domain-containing family member 1B-A isoform X2 [Sturnira hondurensis]|uniref:ras-GEF domain-containing family member 1B-A isoform X2 n=1 Tax=Sturnira hondurensis TaxID=192404 RepID=UPI00187A6127|nr:ras-GEF domain-containing family member 1B-A isoform X2 [Sturnira hondurensis]